MLDSSKSGQLQPSIYVEAERLQAIPFVLRDEARMWTYLKTQTSLHHDHFTPAGTTPFGIVHLTR